MIKFQISNPKTTGLFDPNDSTLEEALETIFPLETEYAFLVWDHIFIPLSYKYDISIMIGDLIRIFHFIKDENERSIEIHWGANTFATIWSIVKLPSFLIIKSTWFDTLGRLKDVLNNNSEIKVDALHLAHEIKVMLAFLKDCLEKAGYVLFAQQIDKAISMPSHR